MIEHAGPPVDEVEEIEGLDQDADSWGDYPIDNVLVRPESRTIHDVIRRIRQGGYVMDPDFQRDFIWPQDKQSKLIESVLMRIPLPVFYLAENDDGRMVVVDGLQRLSTFHRFVDDKLVLKLPDRGELHRKRFSDLPAKLRNRIEDCNLTAYVIDSKVPEVARLDIFERVNGGVPLTRQQMRNSLFMGQATRFLKQEAGTEVFRQATGGSLKSSTMRDREFVNRFCAFRLLSLDRYRGDMDDFLAECLRRMNKMEAPELAQLATEFHRGLANNFALFGPHAFRKHEPDQDRRGVINASLWDVMATGLARSSEEQVDTHVDSIRRAFFGLLGNDDFNTAITYGPNDARKVRTRFRMASEALEEALDAHAD